MADQDDVKPTKGKQVIEADPNILALTQMMAQMVSAMQASQLSKDTIGEILNPIVKEIGSTVHAARWPENSEHPHISVYSYPEGDIARPKPQLSRPTWFCGAREREERLKPSEIDAFNAIKEPCTARGGAWRAEIRLPKAVGGTEELFVWVPSSTVDERMGLPPLLLILHELKTGQSTEDVMDLLQQLNTLKAMVLGKGGTATELEQALMGKP